MGNEYRPEELKKFYDGIPHGKTRLAAIKKCNRNGRPEQ